MLLKKFIASLLVVVASSGLLLFFNEKLLPNIAQQNFDAGMIYLTIVPIVAIFGSVHLIRLILLPFIALFKDAKKYKKEKVYLTNTHY